MSYTGFVKNGVIVLEDGPPLKEGARVTVELVPADEKSEGERTSRPRAASPLGEMLLEFAGIMDGLPEDMARNHDHYIHGTPKRYP